LIGVNDGRVCATGYPLANTASLYIYRFVPSKAAVIKYHLPATTVPTVFKLAFDLQPPLYSKDVRFVESLAPHETA
jgi:hypothetical protein